MIIYSYYKIQWFQLSIVIGKNSCCVVELYILVFFFRNQSFGSFQRFRYVTEVYKLFYKETALPKLYSRRSFRFHGNEWAENYQKMYFISLSWRCWFGLRLFLGQPTKQTYNCTVLHLQYKSLFTQYFILLQFITTDRYCKLAWSYWQMKKNELKLPPVDCFVRRPLIYNFQIFKVWHSPITISITIPITIVSISFNVLESPSGKPREMPLT